MCALPPWIWLKSYKVALCTCFMPIWHTVPSNQNFSKEQSTTAHNNVSASCLRMHMTEPDLYSHLQIFLDQFFSLAPVLHPTSALKKASEHLKLIGWSGKAHCYTLPPICYSLFWTSALTRVIRWNWYGEHRKGKCCSTFEIQVIICSINTACYTESYVSRRCYTFPWFCKLCTV